MQNKSLPSSVAAFLSVHGAAGLEEHWQENLAALVRVFRDSFPVASGSLSPDSLTWLTAVLDCIEAMDERLYEHYRGMIDLFRRFVFSIPRESLGRCPSWESLQEKALCLKLLPEDLYGPGCRLPHLGAPDVYLRMKEEGQL